MHENEVAQINAYMKVLREYVKKDYEKNKKSVNQHVAFSAMIAKKTIDILATERYAMKHGILCVQISLLRLLCDNCLAIQSAYELSVATVYDMVLNDCRVSNLMVSEDQNMSDGYLKRRVAEKYHGFDKLYGFACDSVHFSRQAIRSAMTESESGRIQVNLNVGNKNMDKDLLSNNDAMMTITDIILDMLKNLP